MTLLVRNEADILRANIDYHLAAGVDFIIATDHRSVDATGEILRAYEQAGRLLYLHEASDDFQQSEWVTRMARIATEDFGADWIVNNDCDEFWWTESGDLKRVIGRADPSVAGLRVGRHNFVARNFDEGDFFLNAMRFRKVRSVNTLGDPLPGKVCHRANADVSVGPGNHDISIDGRRPKIAETDEMCIFHFPLRSPAQFSRKIALGGAAYERSGLPKAVGSTWRALYEKQRNAGLDDFFAEAIYDDTRVREALERGEIVEDARLRDFFADRRLPLS